MELGADAIVTPCMSCTFQLNLAQQHAPCFHVLELLYNWRVNWAYVGSWMKIRFLFDDIMGAEVVDGPSNRKFEGLSSRSSADGHDAIADEGVDISNDGTYVVGL